MHHIYKARYFPSYSFLESHLGPNPSYAWRGIWEANPWLKEGSLWHLGNGESVNIWTDRWIPSQKAASFPQKLLGSVTLEANVSQLIDSRTMCWDIQALNSIFSPLVVAAVLKIPLSQTRHDDKLIWGE